VGFSVTWVALRGMTADEACSAMGFERTGEISREPLSEDLAGAELPNGVYLMLASGDGPFMGLSENYDSGPALANEAIHFMCYDTAMITRIGCVADGQRRWCITRSEPGEPFELEGAIPAEYHRLLAKAKEEQAKAGDEVDYLYDVPADLGLHITGFRHDRFEDDLHFEVLHALPSSPYAPRTYSGRQSSGRRSAATAARASSGKPWWKFW
jgi:hypothetical protein